MLNFYFYPMLLTICIILCCYEIKVAQGKLTNKLKILGTISLFILLLRYFCLLLLLTSKNILFLYYIKPFVFSGALALGLLSILSCYIAVRNNYFKLIYVFVFGGLEVIAYIIFMKYTAMNLIFTNDYGYGFKLINNSKVIFSAILIFNLLILLIFILSIKNNKNFLGSILIIISVLTLDAEVIMKILNHSLFQEILLWDFSVLLSYLYVLKKRK